MVLRVISYILCRIFFRSIRLSGSPYLGKSAVWTANHSSAIVDPAVMLGLSPVKLRPLAKHTLWQLPVMRIILKLSGAIPLVRQQDLSEEEKSQISIADMNSKSFKAITEALIEGHCILIFPEGISHDEPYIHKLKSGAARMALQALQESNDPSFVPVIQPVTIDYSEKDEFRSEICIHYCEPIPLTSSDIEFKDLTERVYAAMDEGFASFVSWDEKRNWRFLFEVAYGRTPASGREFKLFVSKFRETFESDKTFMERIQTVRRFLQVLDLSPSQLLWADINRKKRKFLWFIMRYGWFHLLVYAPIQLLGLIVWGVPYKVCDRLAEGPDSARDVKATMKIAHGMYIFPLWALLFATVFTWWMRDIWPQVSFLQTWVGFLFLGPLFLVSSFFLSEKINFFPGYWRLSKIRLFFPRAWLELTQEWTEVSDMVLKRIEDVSMSSASEHEKAVFKEAS